MIITKIFDIILNIDNINYIFSKDINSIILNLVKQKYVNKCYLGVFILDIVKILNRSLIESDQTDLNGLFYVFIQFEATCITYSQNDVILDMEIQENINNSIIVKNENIVAIIKTNKNAINFNKNQKIPIIVGKAKFTTGSSKITINSYPFIPIINNKITYYKMKNITSDDKEKLNELILNYINTEEEVKKNILKIKDNKWNHFANLIHPYKNNTSETILKNNKTMSLIPFDNFEKNINNKIISLNNQLDLSKGLVCVYAEDKINNYLEEENITVIYDIYKKYYLYLKLINDLSQMYNTDSLIADNNNIFELYIKYKK